jgi:hypothetical protein
LIVGRDEMSKAIPTAADVGTGDGAGGGSPILKGDDVEGKHGAEGEERKCAYFYGGFEGS